MFGGSITAVLLNTPARRQLPAPLWTATPQAGKRAKASTRRWSVGVRRHIQQHPAHLRGRPCPISPQSVVEQCSLILLALTVVGGISGSSSISRASSAGVGILLATVGVSAPPGPCASPSTKTSCRASPHPDGHRPARLPEVIRPVPASARPLNSSIFPAKRRLVAGKSRAHPGPAPFKIIMARSSAPCPASGFPAAYMASLSPARTSKHPEQFGKGAIEGVMAPEAANNAVTGSAMIPL